ncbi:MAG: hypothetical protein K2N87_09735 [Eubacterium sp.]|nr:hypothetical protein [Eubacterium sp.]
MSESMFIRLFAGVPLDDFDAIPLLRFGQWLLPVGIFLLAVGFDKERDGKAEMLSLYRYGTVPGWWKRHFGKGVTAGIKTAGLLLFLVLACDIAMGNLFVLSAELLAKISILWLFHSASMAALFALLDLFPIRRFAPGAIFLLEGVTFIIGSRFRAVSCWMYGMWGMYLQSSFCETGGFPAGGILAAEAAFSAAGFWIGREYLKKKRI